MREKSDLAGSGNKAADLPLMALFCMQQPADTNAALCLPAKDSKSRLLAFLHEKYFPISRHRELDAHFSLEKHPLLRTKKARQSTYADCLKTPFGNVLHPRKTTEPECNRIVIAHFQFICRGSIRWKGKTKTRFILKCPTNVEQVSAGEK